MTDFLNMGSDEKSTLACSKFHTLAIRSVKKLRRFRFSHCALYSLNMKHSSNYSQHCCMCRCDSDRAYHSVDSAGSNRYIYTPLLPIPAENECVVACSDSVGIHTGHRLRSSLAAIIVKRVLVPQIPDVILGGAVICGPLLANVNSRLRSLYAKFSAMFLHHLVPWPSAPSVDIQISRRLSQPNPSGWRVKRKRDSQI